MAPHSLIARVTSDISSRSRHRHITPSTQPSSTQCWRWQHYWLGGRESLGEGINHRPLQDLTGSLGIVFTNLEQQFVMDAGD
jgi:hypothetical protein